MTLTEFLDTTYKNLTLELRDNFAVSKDGKVKSIAEIMKFCRFVSKWYWVFGLTFEYMLVKMKIKAEPTFQLPTTPDKVTPSGEAKLDTPGTNQALVPQAEGQRIQ